MKKQVYTLKTVFYFYQGSFILGDDDGFLNFESQKNILKNVCGRESIKKFKLQIYLIFRSLSMANNFRRKTKKNLQIR